MSVVSARAGCRNCTAAAMAACERPEGRPLFAGHLAALTAQGLNGCEALGSHAAAGEIPGEVLQSSRRRSDDDWAAAHDSLRTRGWLDADGSFTDAGRTGRQWIEDRTDELAVLPYALMAEALGFARRSD